MKFLSILVLTVFNIGLAIAQENTVVNDANAKKRTLNGSFTAISVTDGIELYLVNGSEESVAISFSDEKYEEKFKTDIENGVLKLYYDNKGLNWSDNNKRKLKAYVSFKTLGKLTASGGSLVNLPTSITVNNLEMRFSSGSLFEGQVKAKELTVDQNSGSAINMTGSAEKIKIDISSGATFRGYDFKVDYCEAKATSGGGIRISVEKELSAKANSGGGIHYKGSAIIKDIDINSGGIVKKA